MSTNFDFTTCLAQAPELPGVYRMYDIENALLYVGKARHLKKRLTSYFRVNHPSHKTRLLVSKINHIEWTITHNESEALLLENTLIKTHKPRYNILLRDDKSYPYLLIATNSEYPRLDFHRGAKREKGDYYGPYPSTHALRESLQLLQKLFRLRQCRDSFFKHRTRPCLQYQIKRCTAPCVGYISQEDYQKEVKLAQLFLSGKSNVIMDTLTERMQAASYNKQYEKAAQYRDQIANLRRLQTSQHVTGKTGDVDVVAICVERGYACISVLSIRHGSVLGSKQFYPDNVQDDTTTTILNAFLSQYYLDPIREKQLPHLIITNEAIEDSDCLLDVLTQKSGKQIQLAARVRGEKAHWQTLAITNAKQGLVERLADKTHFYQRFILLSEALNVDSVIQRIECFDISHLQGEQTVGSCVVFDHNGPCKRDYRRFTITDITGGDDYAAMNQALKRRYTKVKQGEGQLPDLLIIDGGKGQLQQAIDVLEELQITNVLLLGIAKGVTRKPGFETVYLHHHTQPIILDSTSEALHLLQQIRDEAHRFAITGHRKQRAKAHQGSILDTIEGVGPKRRSVLLQHFGGLQGLKRASVEDIAKVSGINRTLAQVIFTAMQKS